MEFNKAQNLEILSCPECKSVGGSGYFHCAECGGMAMGRFARGIWLYWKYQLKAFNIHLKRGRHKLNIIRLITGLILFLNFWVWLGFAMSKRGLLGEIIKPEKWSEMVGAFSPAMKFFFWFGILSLAYVWYRILRQKQTAGLVERHKFNQSEAPSGEIKDWLAAKRSKHKLNVASTFTQEALSAIGDAFILAEKQGQDNVGATHFVIALLKYNRISNIFMRLGVSAKTFVGRVDLLIEERGKGAIPHVSEELKQILFKAYEEAYTGHQEYVGLPELLLCAIEESLKIRQILFELEVDERKLKNVIEWARIRERLYRQYMKLRSAASHHSKHGMDKAMTALATPYLNRFSEDMTLMAHYGNLEQCVAREREIQDIYMAVEAGQHNIILVGEQGVGRKSIVEGIAQDMLREDVPKELKDKRLVRISVSALLAGASPSDAMERFQNMLNEAARARNVVLFIHNVHELIGISVGEAGSMDVAGALSEFLGGNHVLTFATTTNEEYSRHFNGTALASLFTKVEVPEMDEDQAIKVLESKVGSVEHRHNVFFSYDAIEKAVQLSMRYLREVLLPGNALEILNETASYARNKKGMNSLVSAEEVAVVISEKTKIPVTSVSGSEAEKLLRLEGEMHFRVVGQEEAVRSVANALRRARAEIRSQKRPIANFLFLGPTGVGKTELAKTIAEVYFGGENKMTRLDMSEYQDASSLHRLIGLPGEKGSGILTEAIKRTPFTLLLLDEVEKADPNILNLFLQVMDDGRLTDSTGRVVDFTNVILIATSNAGTSYVQDQMSQGVSGDIIKEKLLHGELRQYFRPEFLNRFDGIILFKELTREDIKQVASMMLKHLAMEFEKKGIEFTVEDAALESLADVGFDPEFGARPMRRALQEKIENKLAELVLEKKLKPGAKLIIGADCEVTVV